MECALCDMPIKQLVSLEATCGHEFHRECIRYLLVRNGTRVPPGSLELTCPACRTGCLTVTGEQFWDVNAHLDGRWDWPPTRPHTSDSEEYARHGNLYAYTETWGAWAVSAVWKETVKAVRAHGTWCFAAAEVTIQGCFGSTISQEQAVHEWAVVTAAADEQGAGPLVRDYVAQVAALTGATTCTWDTLVASCAADGRLGNAEEWVASSLGTSWGQPTLTGRVVTARGGVSPETVKATIDAGGLVAYGDGVRWYVINGYRVSTHGQVEYLVYSPSSGQSAPVNASTAEGARHSYTITG